MPNKNPLMVTAAPARLQLSELNLVEYDGAISHLSLTVTNPTIARIEARPVDFDLSPGVYGEFVVIRFEARSRSSASAWAI